MLFIISTPIGNLKDITYRAVELLKEVDLIACEDTRHTGILCKAYDIHTPRTSYFEHNKIKKADYLLGLLQQGKDVALVTDAGTPGISDPGFHLIRVAKNHDIPMTAAPGATALIAALSLSGLPCHNFIFEGFLPVKNAARLKKLKQLRGEARTLIFYESPHRIVKMLKDVDEVFKNPEVVCARELTKKFEDVKKGTAKELCDYFAVKKPRGEFVVLISLVR